MNDEQQRRQPHGVLVAALVGLASVALASPRVAQACGGCFAPGTSGTGGLPGVEQEGERVLFVQDDVAKVTRVWIEIRYNGPANDFAWVLPLPKKPKVGVGDSWLFDRLDLATMPRFVSSPQPDENCAKYVAPTQAASTTSKSGTPPRAASQNYQGGGCGGGLSGDSSAYSVNSQSTDTSTSKSSHDWQDSGATSARADHSSVTVVAHDQTGPYDYVVLDGKDPAQLVDWLGNHGYAVPPAALPIIQSHVQKGDVFLALRLKNGAGVREIRPVALEMQDADPCVPLRLTSLAAVEDTSVVVYVAGKGRAIPKNFLHVQVDPARLRWFGGVNNYQQVLSEAIDDAGGHAFATEFAGSTQDLQVESSITLLRRIQRNGKQFGVYQPGDALSLPQPEDYTSVAESTTVQDLGIALGSSQLLVTTEVAALLEQHVGLAAKLKRKDVTQVYVGLQTMTLKLTVAQQAWPVPGQTLAKALHLLLDPPPASAELKAMEAAVQAQPTLTRLALLISPEEMGKDPIFAFHPDLAPVSPVHVARVTAVCLDGWYPANGARLSIDGMGSWLFPGAFPNHLSDPRFASAPAALHIELLDEQGPPTPIAQAQAGVIDAAIAGAKPGVASLDPSLTVQKVLPWQPPESDPVVTKKVYAEGGWTTRGLSPRHATLLLALLAATVMLVRRTRAAVRRP
jgi:hypothetical protein